MTYLKVKDHDNLVRDSYSKAILNTDKSALDNYKLQVEIARKQRAEKEETRMRLDRLEQNMSEIKSLLEDIAKMRKE